MTSELPDVFPSPFNNQPHPLAVEAARDLQSRLPDLTDSLHDFSASDGGKMLGVLIVKNSPGKLHYLAGFSGMLGGRWQVDGFVPPVFEISVFQQLLSSGQQALDTIALEVTAIEQSEAHKRAVIEKGAVVAEAESAITALISLHRERREKRRIQRDQYPHDAKLISDLAHQSRADKKERQSLRRQMNDLAQSADKKLQHYTDALRQLAHRRSDLSAQLQKKLFDCYRIPAIDAKEISLRNLFPDSRPPGGAGDCAAVKLLNAAIRRKLTPVCLAEFWWGSDAGLRRHGCFYAACRSKCRPILPYMLQGLPVTRPVHEVAAYYPAKQPETVYEDESIVVVSKPAGMLSVPGQSIIDSVESRLRQRYPYTDNKTLLLHRLDQATSGLMLAARNARAYKSLQHQFQRRTVDKTYIAKLASTSLPENGEITLPLRVDLDDRPRQIVCFTHGKQALTRYRVTDVGPGASMVEFKPVTGRTHQLRVHAAHPDGLNAAIVGDELYGTTSERLFLHAQSLSFKHPISGEHMSFTHPAPFSEKVPVQGQT